MAQRTNDEIRLALLEALEASAPAHGIDIVDVEVVGSAKAPTVRVRIDRTEPSEGCSEGSPITLDEIGGQTGWISDLVDEADPIEGSFTLEVSSPGLARPLRRPHDFERFAGNDVALTLARSEGRKRYSGKLLGFADGRVLLSSDEGKVSFALEDVRSCTIKPDFGNPTGGRGRGRKQR